MRVLAGHGGVHALERVRGLDGEVAAEDGAGGEDGLHAVGLGGEAVGAEAVDGVLHVRGRVRGLDRGQDADGVEALLVVRVDDLGVLDAEAVLGLAGREVGGGRGRGAFLSEGGLEGVDGVAVGEVADGVDVDLEAVGGPGFGDAREVCRVDKEGAGRPGVVGVGVEHGASPASQSAVWRVVSIYDCALARKVEGLPAKSLMLRTANLSSSREYLTASSEQYVFLVGHSNMLYTLNVHSSPSASSE